MKFLKNAITIDFAMVRTHTTIFLIMYREDKAMRNYKMSINRKSPKPLILLD